MTSLIDAIREGDVAKDSRFPHAPSDWNVATAQEIARREGLELGDDHWEAARALQEYFAKHEEIHRNLRELHDALDEKFHRKGGIRYLYTLFPGGPVAQAAASPG